jgi:retinol-binding protein 3
MKYLLLGWLLCYSLVCQSVETSAVAKTQVLQTLRHKIAAHYVMSENLAKIEASLDALAKSPEFVEATDSKAVAALLSAELQLHDKHFAVQWRSAAQRAVNATPSEDWFSKLERKNFGFKRVEILEGNVGYLEFWGFANLSERSRGTVGHMMGLLSGVDALIIDLRHNGGGNAEMVQLLSSYLLADKTHLNSFYSRDTGATTEFWTLDGVGSKFAPDLPLFLLTGAATFSAAEEFAYNLKHLKRATLVGETTKGGANPWRYVELLDGFRAAIPVAKAINPITKTNWEAVGVRPHVAIAAEQAFNEAYILALEALKSRGASDHQLEDIQSKLHELTGS